MAKTCYTTVLAEKLHQYRTEDILCDAVIETRDAPVMAHSLILAAASDQLRIAFLAAEKGCRYQLRLDNYTSVDVVSALRYIYTGSLIDDQCQEQLSNFDRTVALLGELGVLTGRTLAFDESIFTGISKEANTILSLVSREDESVCCSKDELSLLGLCSEPESATTSALADTSEKKPCVGLVRSGSVQAAAVEPATVAADSEHSLTGVVQWHKVAESTRREQATTEDKSETPYVCAYCQASFAVAADLLGHLAAHGETTHCEAHPCDVCGKSFVNSRTLHRHRALHVDPKSHECAICGRSFRYRSRLVQHMRVHTGDMAPESSRTCTICSRQFCTASGLRKHRRIHDTDLPFKCTTCHKAFAFASVLREHERTHSAECPYVCEVCGRSFKHSSNLFKHRRQHHESSLSSSSERPPVQQCANCGSSDSCACEQPPSRQPQDLPTTLTKRYQCDICKKCFASSSYREMHARVHTGERPFKCQICQKSFKQKSNLMKHLHLHGGDRPFSCRFCNKSFALNSNLRDHEKIHTDDRPFACARCDKRFITAAALRAHLGRHFESGSLPTKAVGPAPRAVQTLVSDPDPDQDQDQRLSVDRTQPTIVVHSRVLHSCHVCCKTAPALRRPHACDTCVKSFKYQSHRSTAHAHDSFTIGELVQDLEEEFGDVESTHGTVEHAEPPDECEISAELLEMPTVASYQMVCMAAGVPTLELIQ